MWLMYVNDLADSVPIERVCEEDREQDDQRDVGAVVPEQDAPQHEAESYGVEGDGGGDQAPDWGDTDGGELRWEITQQQRETGGQERKRKVIFVSFANDVMCTIEEKTLYE